MLRGMVFGMFVCSLAFLILGVSKSTNLIDIVLFNVFVTNNTQFSQLYQWESIALKFSALTLHGHVTGYIVFHGTFKGHANCFSCSSLSVY